MWENDHNKNGSKWIMRFKKGYALLFWEELILAFIGQKTR